MKTSTLIASVAIAGANAGVLFNKYPDMHTEFTEGGKPINSKICQTFSNYDFFDLQPFDNINRNKKTHTPTVISGFSGASAFAYKACQPYWTLK